MDHARVERMGSLLLVGDWEDVPTASLSEWGWDVHRAREGVPTDARTARVDCAAVRAGDGALESIEAIGEHAPGLPIVYVTHDGTDGGAETARDRGAADHVHVSDDRDVARLLARIERLVPSTDRADGDGAAASGRAAEYPETAPIDRRIQTLLEHAGALMDAETAAAVADASVRAAERVLGYEFVAVHLLDDRDRFVEVSSSERSRELVGEMAPVPQEETPAGRVLREQQTVEFGDEVIDDVGLDPLQSVLVVPLGQHGVLGFGSTEAGAFGEHDHQVGELLATNATAALDRVQRVGRIERLHHATQQMLDEETPEGVAERAVEAAESILGYEFVGLHTLDDDGETLPPVAWTDATEARYGRPPTIRADEDGPWVAFERGELVHFDEQDEGAFREQTPFESRLYVPIGAVGVLVVAAHEREAFDESDRQLARLLATNTARTLEHVERTQELERYESVFETVTDMVFVLDAEGAITHATPALLDRLGYEPDDLLDEHVSEVVEDVEAISHGVDQVQELLGEPPGTSRTQRFELVTADGDEIPVAADLTLLPGEGFRGVVGTIRDLSDILEVRERLDTQQDRFQYLFEHIPDPVLEADLGGEEATVVSVNGAFAEAFGFDPEALHGRPVNDVIVPSRERERAAEFDRRGAAGEVTQAEVERETQYGIRRFLFRGIPYTTADGETRGFGIYTDITDQRERERHLEVLQRVLRHNVRNDVNVLLGGIEQLEGGGADADTLATLEETAEGLLAMSQKAKRIGSVLEAEREEHSTVDLADLAASVVERYRAADVDATIVADLPASAPVQGSPAIEHALEDLVGNAVEHAGTAPRIEVAVAVGPDQTTATVTDDGQGIPEEERRVLREAEITPLRHGSGLGLWLVKHATEASGGTVTFGESDVEGASVTLSFHNVDGGGQ